MRRILTTASACAVVAACASPIAASQAASSSSSKVSGLDKEYVTSSIQGDRFEIQGGKLALQRSKDAKVRTLAKTLVKDHTKSLSEGIALAKKLGIAVPSSPTPPEQWELQIVRQLKGKTFKAWYSRLEVMDHKQDIKDATDEVSDGSNAAVRSSAKQELPDLRKHEALSKAAEK